MSRAICVWSVGARTAAIIASGKSKGGCGNCGKLSLPRKSRFLLDCVWVDPADQLGISYLRNLNAPTVDGEPCGADFGLAADTVGQTVIAGVRKNVMENFVCALEKTREVMMLGTLLIHEANCPKLIYSLRRPWKDLLQSPIIRGLVCAISGLESSKGLSAVGSAIQPWYANISREKF